MWNFVREALEAKAERERAERERAERERAERERAERERAEREIAQRLSEEEKRIQRTEQDRISQKEQDRNKPPFRSQWPQTAHPEREVSQSSQKRATERPWDNPQNRTQQTPDRREEQSRKEIAQEQLRREYITVDEGIQRLQGMKETEGTRAKIQEALAVFRDQRTRISASIDVIGKQQMLSREEAEGYAKEVATRADVRRESERDIRREGIVEQYRRDPGREGPDRHDLDRSLSRGDDYSPGRSRGR